MADEVSDVNIEKGVHLSVVVEFCVKNIIVVCFKNNGKEYRGVLLESNGEFFPFSFPYAKLSPTDQISSEKEGCLSLAKCDISDQPKPVVNSPSKVNKNVLQNHEISASTQRFSYSNDPFLVTPRLVPELTVVEMKPLAPRSKTIRRDIRLRPRQTLCSNCKCAIHEGRKTRNMSNAESNPPKNPTASVPDSRLRPRVNGTNHISSLQSRRSKRKSDPQSPLVLLEDIKHKSTRLSGAKDLKQNKTIGATENDPAQSSKLTSFESCVESLTNTTNRLRANRRSLLSENNSNHDSNVLCNGLNKEDISSNSFTTKAAKKNRSASTNDAISKPSPTIKISIGAGAILKIPPRLPDSEHCVSDNTLDCTPIQIDKEKDSQQIHKKIKKSARKTKDKDRYKMILHNNNNNESATLSAEQTALKSLKKHKKKHRHRHQSSEPTETCKEAVSKIDDSIETSKLSVNISVPHSEISVDTCKTQVSTVEVVSGERTVIDSVRKVNSPPPQKKIKVGDCFIDVVDISESESDNETRMISAPKDDNGFNSTIGQDDFNSSRPRLLYTWRQDQGLSRVVSTPQTIPAAQPPDQSPRYLMKTSPNVMTVANSPHRRKNASPGRVVNASPNIHFSSSPLIKDYPLRSRAGSLSTQPADLLMLAEHNVVPVSEDSQSHSSGLDSHLSESGGDSCEEEQQIEDIFPGEGPISPECHDKDMSKPLMLKIQTQNVTECVLEEGREIHVGDIVWGKIQGFPWWPGRVSSITVTQRDNNVVINQLANVAWFGSNTMSHVHCCELFPFLQDFKIRYNKKKKGPYKTAIKQATLAAQSIGNGIDHSDLLDFTD